LTHPYDLLIFDTYGVTFLRSPLYLEEPLIEELDEVSRELVDAPLRWRRLLRRHGLTGAALEAAQDRLAAKFCRNLNVWQVLPEWGRRYHLLLLHGGPPGLLDRWRREYDLERVFADAATTTGLGRSRTDPALYARLAADAGLPPDRCLVIDDERAPLEAARQAGLAGYRFGTVYGLRGMLET
jgi:FMN phosphatase YigB (HAD superfamily)